MASRGLIAPQPPGAVHGNRPAAVWVMFGVLVFLGVTAVAGGVQLAFGWGTGQLPGDVLDRIPLIDSWLVPGLVLGIGFGLGSLGTAYGVLRALGWAWAATILIGLGHLVWILLELVYLPGISFLEVLYGTVGVALVLLPWARPVRRYLRVRP